MGALIREGALNQDFTVLLIEWISNTGMTTTCLTHACVVSPVAVCKVSQTRRTGAHPVWPPAEGTQQGSEVVWRNHGMCSKSV